MTDNISKVCPAIETTEKLKERLWELQLALGVEFMRGSYRQDLTPPKRVLGLRAASEALSIAESSYYANRRKK